MEQSSASHSSTTSNKHIWMLAWPMILANVATTLIGIVDTAILGHLPDPAFIGGVAVASSLFNLLYMSLAFLRMGTTGLIAQHFGEKNWQALYSTLVLSSMIAFGIGSLLVLFSSWVFSFAIPLIGGSDNVQAMAWLFADIRVLSSPFVLFNFVAVGFLIGIQKSKQALALLMFSQAINIFLDFYLAVYLEWDIEGVAWATMISDVCGSLLALFFMFQFIKPRINQYFEIQQVKQKLSRIFLLNKDIFFRTVVLISIFAFITAQSARQGDVILAANSILIQIFFFLANAIDGFANAAESRTGELVGEHRKASSSLTPNEINRGFVLAISQGFIFLMCSLLILVLLSESIIALISNQATIIVATLEYFWWLPALMLCSHICFVIDGVFIGATKSRAMLIAIASSTVLVFFPAWYLLQGLENHGIWLALCLFMVFRSALSFGLYRRILRANQW